MKKVKLKKLTTDQRKISLLEAQLASATWNIDQHHIKCNHLEIKVLAAEEAMKRAQEDANRCRGRHQRLVEEIKTVRQFLSEVSPTDCSAVLLQRTIGIVQGHLAVIVEQNKPVFNKVSDYIRESERTRNKVMNDMADSILYGMNGKKP